MHPSSDATEFAGTWSNYPYFDSGTIVVTGYDGVWLLRLHDEVAAGLGLAADDGRVTGEDLPEPAADRARTAVDRRGR